jgi:hypothetical protein
MKAWKVLGLAGIAGVAATGVIIVRDERRRAQLTPEEIRDRLHQRLDQNPPSTVSGASRDARSPGDLTPGSQDPGQ